MSDVDWFADVPATDDECREALRFQRDDLTGRNLVGIFNVRRRMGDSMLQAYEMALRALLPSGGAQ